MLILLWSVMMNSNMNGEITAQNLMAFMTSFHDSIEEKIKGNNDKLDWRLDVINKEIN